MMRVILRARTGNILFQYAIGRYLAKKHGVPLVMDASWYNREGWKEVSYFLKLPLNAKVIRRLPLVCRALRKFTKKHYWQIFGLPLWKEDPTNQTFNSDFLNAPSGSVLYGYFQTPKYFDAISNELREELRSLIEQGAGANTISCKDSCEASLQDHLSSPNSVAVHVRRGDYLKLPAFQVCGENYYSDAIQKIRHSVQDPRFYIFSDDPAWCKKTFTDADCVIIDSGKAAQNPLHDLHLMSLASHHIIPNSSYSWWAAWLGDKPNQQIIMPDRWFNFEVTAPMEEKKWK
jgi:hypothetical protein